MRRRSSGAEGVARETQGHFKDIKVGTAMQTKEPIEALGDQPQRSASRRGSEAELRVQGKYAPG